MKIVYLLILLLVLLFGFKKYVEKQTDKQLHVNLDDPRLTSNYVSIITFAKNKETGESEKYILSRGPTPAHTFGKLSFRKVSSLSLSRERNNIKFILEKADTNKFFLKAKPVYKNKPSLYIKTADKLTDTVSSANESFLKQSKKDIKPLEISKGENNGYKINSFPKNIYFEISKEEISYAAKPKLKKSAKAEENDEPVIEESGKNDEPVIEEPGKNDEPVVEELGENDEPVVEESEEIDEPVIEGFQGFR